MRSQRFVMTRNNNEATVSPSCKRPSQNMLLSLPLCTSLTGLQAAVACLPHAYAHSSSFRHPTPTPCQAQRRPGRTFKELLAGDTGTQITPHKLENATSIPLQSFPLGPQFPWSSLHLPLIHGLGGESVGNRPSRKSCPMPSPNQPRQQRFRHDLDSPGEEAACSAFP